MRAVGWVLVALVVAALGALLWFATRPPPLVLQGEVSANRVDISARVAGRVLKLNTDVGRDVKAGDVVVELESPQLEAARLASAASVGVARADLARIGSTRPETIDARRAELAAAEADVKLYQDAYDRQTQLIRTGATPQSRVDEATRNLEAALRKREAATAALRLATEGASPEERALAAAQVKQAEAGLAQRETDIQELTVRAPIAGQVTTRVAEVGGNYGAGAPLLSLIDLSRPWFTFNLREDLLHGLKVGETFKVDIPALGKEGIEVRVTVINVQGQFATWRATRATGGFDLRTFEVRAEPVAPVEGLRPGMSVIAQWSNRGR